MKRIVIKIGSSNLVKEGKVDDKKIKDLVEIVERKRKDGYEFIIVSSGAVAVGKERLGIEDFKLNIRQKQALAAVGQPLLMRKYKEAFEECGIIAAQILLTSEDLNNRKRYINSRETIWELLKYKVVPIINENDTVSMEEIKIGDNDNLSAILAAAVEADQLIILSDIEGLYNKNPNKYDDAVLLKDVKELSKEIIKGAGGTGSKFGTGGMKTKLEAAKICMNFAIEMFICNGNNIKNIEDILENKEVGTKFHPKEKRDNSRKMWIAYSLKDKGKIIIDSGAKKALLSGKSLLPSGVVKLEGNFNMGDMVKIMSEDKEIGRGLINYGVKELEKIKRKKTTEIELILGYKYQDEIVHRDNMLLIKED